MNYNLPSDIDLTKLDSTTFDIDVYNNTGVFILRNYIPIDIIASWQSQWDDYYNEIIQHRVIDSANPVNISKLPTTGELATLYLNDYIVDLAKVIHGNDVALYNYRFVIKDKYNTNKVMLHQDSCYHLGNLNKCSFFIPIYHVGPFNGGLEFYPGTHHYGYLGDAGEVDPDSFEQKWQKIAPTVNPGDLIVMNSHTWHGSPINTSGVDRIVIDIITQPANDPTGEVLLAGEWKTNLRYSKNNPTQYFKTSRILKLKNNGL